MKSGQRKLVKIAGLVLCPIIFIAVAYFWYMEEQGNFHSVTPGEAFRSAQLDQDDLEKYIRKFKIRSILNLRGKCTDKAWYKEEIATCRRLGVAHFDLALSSSQAPSSPQIKELLRLFRFAPRPILMHCQGGADRSGLASAFWKVIVDHEPSWVAEQQLSIRYGHMPFGPTHVLDEFFHSTVNKISIGNISK